MTQGLLLPDRQFCCPWLEPYRNTVGWSTAFCCWQVFDILRQLLNAEQLLLVSRLLWPRLKRLLATATPYIAQNIMYRSETTP
jgi:hypothetical protein